LSSDALRADVLISVRGARWLLALVVVVSGCSGPGAPSAAPNGPIPQLEQTSWFATSVNGVNIDLGRINESPTISFDGDVAHGSTGCNEWTGVVAVGPGSAISMNGISSTKRACPGERAAQEETFVLIMATASTFEGMDDEWLRIRGATGSVTFRPIERIR